MGAPSTVKFSSYSYGFRTPSCAFKFHFFEIIMGFSSGGHFSSDHRWLDIIATYPSPRMIQFSMGETFALYVAGIQLSIPFSSQPHPRLSASW